MPESFSNTNGEGRVIDERVLQKAIDDFGKGLGDEVDLGNIGQKEDMNVMNIGALTDKMAGGSVDVPVKSL